MGVKKYHKRRRDELREEELARNNLAWAGHGVRMGDEKLAKSADIQKVEGKRGKEDRNYNGSLPMKVRKRMTRRET